MALGQAHMELGDASASRRGVHEGTRAGARLARPARGAGEASAMTEGRGPSDASALMEQNRALLAGAASADERFEILAASAACNERN